MEASLDKGIGSSDPKIIDATVSQGESMAESVTITKTNDKLNVIDDHMGPNSTMGSNSTIANRKKPNLAVGVEQLKLSAKQESEDI